MPVFVALILIGLVAGFLSGLLGIGGGIIIVPALILIVGILPHQAIAISLAVIVPASISGALKHYSAGGLDLKMALIIAVGAVVGAFLGASAANALSGETLKKLLGLTLVLIGCNMLFGWTGSLAKPSAQKSNEIGQN